MDSYQRSQSILDSIPSQVAVLSADGAIIQVNEAWSRFARENHGSQSLADGVGSNYLEICQNAEGVFSDQAPAAVMGIRSVLSGAKELFSLEYPCHSPTERRWFFMTVTPLEGADEEVVVTHLNVTERKLSEMRQTSLDEILEQSLDEIYIFDAKTLLFVYVNEGAQNNLGYSLDELKARSPIDISPEFTRVSFDAELEFLRTGARKKLGFVTLQKRKDGTTYPVDVHLKLTTFGGKPVFTQINLDITQRTQTEEALAQSRLFLESAPDASIVVNSAGKIKVANAHMSSLFGYSPNELRGMPIERLIPDRYRGSHVGHRETYDADPTVRNMGANMDLFALTKGGSEIPIEVSLSPIPTGDGVLIAAAIRDISTKKKAQKLLRASEARYRDLFENANDLIQSFAPDGHFFFVNNAWRRTLGYSDDDIASLTMFDVVHSDSKAHCEDMFGRAMSGQVVDHFEATFVAKNGNSVFVEGSASCHFRDAKVLSTRAIFHNVTERKAAEDALVLAKEVAERATAGKSRFLAAASHDLRQPLQAIGMYLSVLTRIHDQPKQKEVGEKMLMSLDTMGELLDALLDISKLDGGSVVPEKRDIAVRDVLNRIVTDNLQQAEAKGLTLNWTCEDCTIHTDPALVGRVVENFVTNAIRYTERGEITIDCRQIKGIARISVTDTGIGMPANTLDKVFDEYYQLDNDVRDRRKGLGLGLSIVKHIARLLDHSLKVTSVEGKGSTFSVDVPFGSSEPVVEQQQTAQMLPDRTRVPVILFVDDDPAVVDATSMMLEGLGIEVYTALCGDEALEHLAGGVRPDLLVSDFRLPDYDGVEVVKRVRAATVDDLPSVIMTGDTSAREIEAAKLTNCTVLHKPVDTNRLMALIQDLTLRAP